MAIKAEPVTSNIAWKWGSADWDGFTRQMESAVDQFDDAADLSSSITQLTDAVMAAAKANIQVSCQKRRDRSWLTSEIKAAIRERNRLRRTVRSNIEEWVRQCETVRSMIAQAKEKQWITFVEDTTINSIQPQQSMENHQVSEGNSSTSKAQRNTSSQRERDSRTGSQSHSFCETLRKCQSIET